MELDDYPDMSSGDRMECLPSPSYARYLLPNSTTRGLTSVPRKDSDKLPDIPADNGLGSSSFAPVVNTQSGCVISKIEDILDQMLDCIIDENKELVLHLKPRIRSGNQVIGADSGAIKTSSTIEARTIGFPGRTAQEAWKFSRWKTVFLRILELSHEALVSGVVTTKRDMYYRDPELFLKQSVVDRYVDDIAFNFGVKREALNVVAAAKGLVAGHLSIVKIDETEVDCRVGTEGVLVPSLGEIDYIDIRGARWALVIEKEATFRGLVGSRFWETSPAGKGILITGKGYPDIQTREFVRFISTRSRLKEQGLGPSFLRVFALMDFDPDGLAIMSTYKHGSISLAHENDTLVAPSIEWLGITSDVIRDVHSDKTEAWLRLTTRDRRKAFKMLEQPVCQEGVEGSWRRELQVLLMLNVKAEIQILGEHYNLEDYLSSALQSHMSLT